MRMQSFVTATMTILIVAGIIWGGYNVLFKAAPQTLFKTQKPERRDIHKVVHAEGALEAQRTSKLGPLINATVKKIYVKEGEQVAKGTLLADLENDTGGDCAVRQAKALLEQAQAMYTYTAAVYERRYSLYEAGELSKEAYQKDLKDYKHTKAEVARLQAAYEKELFLLEQTHIRAPHDGTVIAVNVKEGETVSPSASPAIVLFELAQDLTTMKATLYINESNIGDIKIGMTAEISVDTYPNQPPWTGTIESIGMSKASNPSFQTQQGQVTYKTEIFIDNREGLLRQDMSVHAKATIAHAKQVLTVPGFVFQLNSKVVEAIAKAAHHSFNPLDPAKKAELLKTKGKTLWVVANKMITEKAVDVGITDNAYFQILSGIQETDEIMTDDMTVSEELKKIAKHVAGG